MINRIVRRGWREKARDYSSRRKSPGSCRNRRYLSPPPPPPPLGASRRGRTTTPDGVLRGWRNRCATDFFRREEVLNEFLYLVGTYIIGKRRRRSENNDDGPDRDFVSAFPADQRAWAGAPE